MVLRDAGVNVKYVVSVLTFCIVQRRVRSSERNGGVASGSVNVLQESPSPRGGGPVVPFKPLRSEESDAA